MSLNWIRIIEGSHVFGSNIYEFGSDISILVWRRQRHHTKNIYLDKDANLETKIENLATEMEISGTKIEILKPKTNSPIVECWMFNAHANLISKRI